MEKADGSDAHTGGVEGRPFRPCLGTVASSARGGILVVRAFEVSPALGQVVFPGSHWSR